LGWNIPMIFMTAYPDDNVRTRALNAGAVCFLHKPFDAQSLIRCVDDALGRPTKEIAAD
jgi:FixJ family two-component response regulator